MYVYICICMYISTHTHTHTHRVMLLYQGLWCALLLAHVLFAGRAFFLTFFRPFLGSLLGLSFLLWPSFLFQEKLNVCFFASFFVVCVCARAYPYISLCVCVCVFECIYVCVFMCVCVCVCVTEGFPLLIRRRACTFMLHPPWSGAGGLMWGLGVGCMCLHVALLVVSAVLVWWQLGMCVCVWVLVCGWVRVCLCMRVFARDVCL